MKRILVLTICLAMLLSTASALADKVSFTASQMSQIVEGGDYTHDDVFYTLSDMFNFTYTLYPVDYAVWHEKNTLWITSGQMPNMVFYNFNFIEYSQYVEQELIGALPDGWEAKYPNLAALVEATGIADKIKVDGKTYCVPSIIFWAFAPVSVPIPHDIVYYRYDWAQQLGYDWPEGVATISEFQSFLKDAIDAKLDGKEVTKAWTGASDGYGPLMNSIINLYSPDFSSFYKQDGKYVWGPTQPGVVEGISRMRDLYQKGLVDPEFYLNQPGDSFYSGTAAAFSYGHTADHTNAIAMTWLKMNGTDPYEHVHTLTLTDDEGKYTTAMPSSNFWSATLFSPDNTPEQWDAMLSLYDYLATVEGQELVGLGIKGVDWDKNEDGTYKILREANEDGTYPLIKQVYPSCSFWMLRDVLPDSFAFVDPARDLRFTQLAIDAYKWRLENGTFRPYDPDYAFYVSDAKSQYGLQIREEIVRIVVDPSLDVETAWNTYIETNRPIWEPLLNELNENFGE